MATLTTGSPVDVPKLIAYLTSSGGSDTLEFPTNLESVKYCNTLLGNAEAHSQLSVVLRPPKVTLSLRR